MLKKEFICDISGKPCRETCRYCRPEVMCLHYTEESWYVCDECLKWIDDYSESPVIVGNHHYHKDCFKEVGKYAILSSNT